MPDFAYTARDVTGNRISGVVSAASEREAIAALAAKSLFPLEVKTDLPKLRRLHSKRIRGPLVVATFSQLSALLRSGVSLLRAIEVIREQTSHEGLSAIMEDVHHRVAEGESLAEAMAVHPQIFSDIAISMVRAGGEGGFLEEALDRVAAFSETQQDLRSRVAGALAYPIFLLVFCFLIVTGLLIFFVPSFAEIFDRLRERGELPIATEGLLWLSATLQKWGLLVVIMLVGGSLLARRRLATEAGRHWLDATKLSLPLTGRIYENLAVARFCRVLGTLLRNGVPILRSLEISRAAAGNRVLSNAIAEASENVSAGESLAEPLGRCDFFPRDVVEMIAVAEESNTLDQVLVDVADRLERTTTRRLELLVRLIEPVMLLFLAGLVLLIALALLLPVLKMHGSL